MMKFVEDTNFDEYVEAFKKLPLEKKKEILITDFKELLIVINKLNNNNKDVLFNRELLEVNQTEDDFVEAIFVYLCSIKESLGNYINESYK